MSNAQKLKEVYSIITSLLTGEPENGVEIVKLDGLYRDMESERIPFRSFGYASLTEFLKSIPEIDIQNRFGKDLVYFSGKESSQHVRRLVARQRAPKRYDRSRSVSKRIPPQYHTQTRRVSPSQQYDQISEEILDIVLQNPRGLSQCALLRVYMNRYPKIDIDNEKFIQHLKILQNEVMMEGNMVFPRKSSRSLRTSTPRSHSVHRANPCNDRKNGNDVGVNGTITSDYRVTPYSDDENLSALDDDNFEFVPRTNKLDEKGDEYSVVDVPQTKTSSDAVNNPTAKNDYHCSENQYPEKGTYSGTLSEQKEIDKDAVSSENRNFTIAGLNARVHFRLEKLIQNNPDGISCIDLPKKYQEEYGVTLDWESLGFHRIGDFAAHLPDIFHLVGPTADGNYRLYNAKDPVPTDQGGRNRKQKLTDANVYTVYYREDDDTEAVPSHIPPEFKNQIFPEDVMMNGESVGQISATQFKVFTNELDRDHSLVAVRVVEAFSPSFFWIHIEKKRRKFEDMMTRLHNFYEARKAEYIIPIIMLERGLNIACMFFGKWHRAIIKAVDSQCQVTVLFYDFGTVKTYPSNQIFYLHRSFSTLPAQAIPCGLYNVKPYEGITWPKNAIDWFVRRVHDRVMWMIIGRIDIETNSMLISLTDTSGVHDFHVSDKMFENKLAIRGSMDVVDPEDLSNYVEDYGEDLQIFDECDMHRTEPHLDNVFKLPPGISSVTVDNLCCGLSILEKNQTVIMMTPNSINNLQNPIRKIVSIYSRMLLTMNPAIDSEKLTSVINDLTKAIIDEFHTTLTTVQMDAKGDLSGTESLLATKQADNEAKGSKASLGIDNHSNCNGVESESNPKEETILLEDSQLHSKNSLDKMLGHPTRYGIESLDTMPLKTNIMNGINNIPGQSHVTNISVVTDKAELEGNSDPLYNINEDVSSSKFTGREIAPRTFQEDEMETARSRLERAITNTCRNFLERHEAKTISNDSYVEQDFHPIVDYLNDTNPFKKDLMSMSSASISKMAPPVPPRSKQEVKESSVKMLSSFIPDKEVKIVYQAFPVLYDLSKRDFLFETKLSSEVTSCSSTQVKYDGNWNGVDLSAEDDDKGYQSDSSSAPSKCVVLTPNQLATRACEEKLCVDLGMNEIKPMMDDFYSVIGLTNEKNLRLVELTTDVTCIFHIRGEGWIPVKEFISIFTSFGDTHDFYKLLDSVVPKTAFLMLKRTQNAALFEQYERTMTNSLVSYQSIGECRSLVECEDLALIQLSSILKILIKLGIITKEDLLCHRKQEGLIDCGSSRVIADAIKLISTYGSTYGSDCEQKP